MGKSKKNSNYQTAKKEAERLAKENELRAARRNKIILAITIPAVSVALIVVTVLSIVLGWFAPKTHKVTYIATMIFDQYEGIVDEDGNPTNAVVEIELYGEAAPITVANFVKLCNEGYYDGTYFHRIVDGFIAQGGDGDGKIDGVSEGEDSIKGEFSANKVKNKVKHERGVISMARTSYDYDSASTQFFIVLETSEDNTEALDGYYAAFGKVRRGMSFFDIVCKGVNSDALPDSILPEGQRPRILSLTVETPEQYAKRTSDV